MKVGGIFCIIVIEEVDETSDEERSHNKFVWDWDHSSSNTQSLLLTHKFDLISQYKNMFSQRVILDISIVNLSGSSKTALILILEKQTGASIL